MRPSILAIDNDPWVLVTLKMVLQDQGVDVQIATKAEVGLAFFKENPSRFAAVILDFDLGPDCPTGDVIACELKSLRSDIKIIVVSGKETPERTQACITAGADQFLLKATDTQKLITWVKSITLASQDIYSVETEAIRQEKIKRVLKMVGRSRELVKVGEMILRFAPLDEPILILGESGVGKEAIARAAHDNSSRRTKPYLALNCANFSKELLESELFGHERGSFTSAVTKKIGLFEQVNGGTIFLDEIGDMPIDLQAKILRALQEKTIQPIGGVPKKVDFRIVAATHRNLRKFAEDGLFRQDLFYRLQYFTIDVPPLRERPEDIEPLVYHFLSQMVEKTNVKKGVSDRAMCLLKSKDWPGNVRELEGMVKRAYAMADRKIMPKDLKAEVEGNAVERLQTLRFQEDMIPHEELMKLHQESERWLLTRAMELAGNVKSAAAVFLGMNHNTMNYRRSILGLEGAEGKKKGVK